MANQAAALQIPNARFHMDQTFLGHPCAGPRLSQRWLSSNYASPTRLESSCAPDLRRVAAGAGARTTAAMAPSRSPDSEREVAIALLRGACPAESVAPAARLGAPSSIKSSRSSENWACRRASSCRGSSNVERRLAHADFVSEVTMTATVPSLLLQHAPGSPADVAACNPASYDTARARPSPVRGSDFGVIRLRWARAPRRRPERGLQRRADVLSCPSTREYWCKRAAPRQPSCTSSIASMGKTRRRTGTRNRRGQGAKFRLQHGDVVRGARRLRAPRRALAKAQLGGRGLDSARHARDHARPVAACGLETARPVGGTYVDAGRGRGTWSLS
jgi:hypothetical protein